MVKDSAPEKWEYQEHTRVKHELLKKYLYAWVIKLGKFYRRVVFFDGFAGKGEYTDGTLGSPVIALELANRLLEQCESKKQRPYFDQFVCVGIEKDPQNFENLQNVIERERAKLKFNNRLYVTT
jgi:three-Cys-motif partner protein